MLSQGSRAVPEGSVNAPLSRREALHTLFHEISRLIELGACFDCATAIAAHTYSLDHVRVMTLYAERDHYGYSD